jgi:aminoglycoside phosphotransferase (APT) family kinase protein
VTTNRFSADDVLTEAARIAGIDAGQRELIRDGSNVMYQLGEAVMARIGRPGSADVAEREVHVAHWLAEAELPAVEALSDVRQAIIVNERPVTWWKLLPEHRPATTSELGSVLNAFHALPAPQDLLLPLFDPFAGIEQRIADTSGAASDDDCQWLTQHLAEMKKAFATLAFAASRDVIHGDAWQGNVAVPHSGTPILLDLEMVSLGDHAWDLVQIAVDYTDFARLTATDYRSFVTAYDGTDLTETPGFRTFADIQELRWVSFALSKSDASESAATEARHRIACLRGDVPRPWTWDAF